MFPESMRVRKIIGNWKMYKTIAEAKAFVASLAFVAINNPIHIGLAVPFTMIASAAEAARGTLIAIGAQNMSDEAEGPYTGEVSCQMIKDAGASFVIIGHSERRRLFQETDFIINRKVIRAVNSNMQTVLCIGETLEEYNQGVTKEVLKKQIMENLQAVTVEQMKLITLAYEPVWAIGTGQSATAEIAEHTHQFCRELIANKWGKNIADHLVIQYGGSVKPENAGGLLDQIDIDGFLVGGASLSLDSFTKIIQSQQIKVS
jgi:triosephosphate isomerase (TIM)